MKSHPSSRRRSHSFPVKNCWRSWKEANLWKKNCSQSFAARSAGRFMNMGKNAGAAMITTITMMRIPMKESIIMKIILMATITAGKMITAITT